VSGFTWTVPLEIAVPNEPPIDRKKVAPEVAP
jgi:hypothetical protein